MAWGAVPRDRNPDGSRPSPSTVAITSRWQDATVNRTPDPCLPAMVDRRPIDAALYQVNVTRPRFRKVRPDASTCVW